MEDKDKKRLLASIAKKAAGYRAVETQEEYALVDGAMTLVKRKITEKDIPPDTAALRLLLGDEPPQTVTKEELERERKELQEAYFRRCDARQTSEKQGDATRKNE